MKYMLAAFDMDGTLLDSNKNIREDSLHAMTKASQKGKYLCLSTGRNQAEIKEYLDKLSDMQYLMCISGALIIDNKTKEIVYSNTLDKEIVLKLFEIGSKYDALVHIHSTDSHFEYKSLDVVSNYGMGQYIELFKRICVFHNDMAKEYKENPFPIYKFNFYCKNQEERAKLEKALTGLPITMCYAETKSLEISPLGISKASGLMHLCEYLNIPIDETIAVGDAENDIEILKAAGLGVAMGNAFEPVKEIADVIVSDCDSTGIKEVIEDYLLKYDD